MTKPQVSLRLRELLKVNPGETVTISQAARILRVREGTARMAFCRGIAEGWVKREGRGLYRLSQPPLEAVPSNVTTPSSFSVEKARFRIPILSRLNPPVPTATYTWGPNRVHHGRVNLQGGLSAKWQAVGGRTVLVQVAPFSIAEKAVPSLNPFLRSLGERARETLSRLLGATLGDPEPIPDEKAAAAEWPLTTGEIRRGLDVAYVPRLGIDGATEINSSGEGPAVETADIMRAVVSAAVPGRILALEAGQARLADSIDRFDQRQAETLERLGKMADAVQAAIRGPPAETPPTEPTDKKQRLAGYA